MYSLSPSVPHADLLPLSPLHPTLPSLAGPGSEGVAPQCLVLPLSFPPQGPAPKVLHCDIYVAERFIGWQEKSLVALQQSFDAKAKVRTRKRGGGLLRVALQQSSRHGDEGIMRAGGGRGAG